MMQHYGERIFYQKLEVFNTIFGSDKMFVKPGYFSQTSHADLRRDEYDLKNEIILTNNVEVDYLFIGDSIIARWELESYYKDLGIVINRGIGGDNSHYLTMRLEADAIQLKPKNLVLLIGVNDTMFLGTKYVLVDTSYEVLRERIIKNTKDIVERALENNISIYVGAILPTNMKNDIFLKERNTMIKEVNKEIKEFCTLMSIKYIDYHKAFVDDDGLTLKDGYCNDGVHPNVKGYNLMNKILREAL
ncbi:G-D-S-L family lipolytic protein [Clostridium paraputrificum]